MEQLSYSAAMGEHPVHLVLTIDTQEPIELGDFVAAFTSLAEEFERYIKREHPDLSGEAQVYVKEVRRGSIEADMLPWLALAAPFIADMDKVLIVEQFVKLWGRRLTALLHRKNDEAPQTKAELKAFADSVAAIANDPNGSVKLAAAAFEDGERKIRASFIFNTAQARIVRAQVDRRLKDMAATTTADHERVFMVFERADFRDAKVGKPTGEMVRIDRLSDKALPLLYAAPLAEERIKSEMRDEEDNIFYKGFVVDVNVESRADGKPVAYSVTHVHQVVDLPPDDDSGEPKLIDTNR
jgi:hypothetical protein